jgi:membrane-associated phospholipid phosphatase
MTRADARLLCAGLAAVLGFTVLAFLVAAGRLDTVDSFSVEHLMPWFPPNVHGSSFLGSLLSYHGRQFHLTLGIKLPADGVVSSALVLILCAVLWLRQDRKGTLLWLAGFVVAVLVEMLSKSLITRPPLSTKGPEGSSHVTGFDASFPSGHALRGVLLAAIIVYTWPSLRWVMLAWITALVLTLELNGVHTPSDISGGLFLALATIIAVALAGARLRLGQGTSRVGGQETLRRRVGTSSDLAVRSDPDSGPR